MKAGQWEALLDANGFGCRVRWAPNTAAPIGWVDRYEDDSEAGAGKLNLGGELMLGPGDKTSRPLPEKA